MFDRQKTVARLRAQIEAADKVIGILREEAATLKDRAYVVGIEAEGRTLRMYIVRNNQSHVVETYASMGFKVNALRDELLGEL